ncbi:MAG: trypsin-like peptidase domain-containing protein [Stackebrandtia sp.]
MRKLRSITAASALALVAAVAVTATAASASADPAGTGGEESTTRPAEKEVKEVNFAGTVALDNCSGSLVTMPNSAPEDPAFVMSNGHCLESGMPGPGEVIVDEPSSRSFELLDASANSVGTLTASKIAYATMTDTDVSLYQLDETYAEISEQYQIDALKVSAEHPAEGTAITVVSGYWQETYSCDIDGFVYELHEADWVWKDSVRYTDACKTKGGTSGSPVIDDASNEVVAVNNTGNESGEECTMNNPCEVDENGEVTVREGINYGQETYIITSCVDTGNVVNLELDGCTLPKP